VILKFVTLTFIQGNESFPKEEEEFFGLQAMFQAFGYTWMAILVIMFTERYIRECYFCYRKWQYNLLCKIVNWVQFFIFALYAIYALTLGCLHFYALHIGYVIGKYTGLKVAIYVMDQFVIWFVVHEKLDHLASASQSCSFFLGEAAHIPPHKHEDNEVKGKLNK
jgi:hypothetical protein